MQPDPYVKDYMKDDEPCAAELADQHDIKRRLNNILWESLPPDTTLEEAENLACRMFGEWRDFVAGKVGE